MTTTNHHKDEPMESTVATRVSSITAMQWEANAGKFQAISDDKIIAVRDTYEELVEHVENVMCVKREDYSIC